MMKAMAFDSAVKQVEALAVVAIVLTHDKHLPKQVAKAARKQLRLLHRSGRWTILAQLSEKFDW